MLQIKNYIGGHLHDAINHHQLENINPATGKVYSLLPDSDKDDVEAAVTAAEAAFEKWSNTPAEDRCKIMLRIADMIDAKLDHLSAIESTDQGKPFKLARTVDIPRAASNFRFFATAALQFASESHHMENMAINYTLRQPIGVVGCISPWNLPLYLFT